MPDPMGGYRYPVTALQRFCMHDGPGLRTTVFLKGCPLHCRWCHNPETQSREKELLFAKSLCIGCGACGDCPGGAQQFSPERRVDRDRCLRCMDCTERCPTGALRPAATEMDADAILAAVERDRPFYGETGGVTLSGGEPMLHGKHTLALLQRFREAGISTAVESCGIFDPALLPSLAKVCDLLLFDYKDSDPVRLRENTGADLQRILQNLHTADRLGIPIRLRCILLEGINAEEAHLASILALRDRLTSCVGVDLLPYHPMGESKAKLLGSDGSFHRVTYIPAPEKIERFRALLNAREKG